MHYLYGGIRLQTPGDRLTGAAQAQLSVLLGVFVLAKAADYWLDRYDLVHQKGSLLTGITYTDDNAVLPAKVILMGIAVICAVLFFLNVWRRTWLLPSMGLALLVLSAILLGLIWPGIVQQFRVKPTEADKEREYIEKNIAATRQAYDIGNVQEESLTPSGEDATLAGLATQVSSVPLVDPQLVRRDLRAEPAGPRLLHGRRRAGRRPLRDQRDRPGAGARGPRARPGAASAQATRTGSTCTRSTRTATASSRRTPTSATANRTPDDTDSDDDRTQWAEGNAANQTDLAEAVGGFEDRVYFGEQSPDYSVVGRTRARTRSS